MVLFVHKGRKHVVTAVSQRQTDTIPLLYLEYNVRPKYPSVNVHVTSSYGIYPYSYGFFSSL